MCKRRGNFWNWKLPWLARNFGRRAAPYAAPRAERAQQISGAERGVIAGGVPPRGEQALLSRLEAAAETLSLRAVVAVVPREEARARGGVDEAVARAKLLPVNGVSPRPWASAQHIELGHCL